MKTNHQLGVEIISRAFTNFLTITKKDYKKYAPYHLEFYERDEKVVQRWLVSKYMSSEKMIDVLRVRRENFWQLPHFFRTAFEGYFTERYEKIKKESRDFGDQMSSKEASLISNLLEDRQIIRRFLLDFLCEELVSSGMSHAEMSADVLRLCLEKQIRHI